VSYFVHATEDGPRVDQAVSSFLETDEEPRREALEGHHGNPIVATRFQIVGEGAQSAVAAIFSKMTREAKDTLRLGLEGHMDEHSALYLRLDKQKLLAGEVALTDSDPVRVKVKPRLHAVGGSAGQLFRGLLE